MRSYWRALALAMAAIGFVMAPSGAAQARCATVFATDDGPFKSFAVQASLTALKNEIEAVKAKWRVSQVTLSPARPKPNPYWRGEVTADLYQKPDIITSTAHTTCWRGVVSPSVCTSGAKVCW